MEVNLTCAIHPEPGNRERMLAPGRGKIICSVAADLSRRDYRARVRGQQGRHRAVDDGVSANEWAGHGVNVNAIGPVTLRPTTPALRADPVPMKAVQDRIPAGRWGRPEDLKGAVVFLASRASDYCWDDSDRGRRVDGR